MAIEEFGQTADGETVHRVTLEGGGLTARIMTWGAALQELRLEGHVAPLTLGFPNFASYPASPLFRADRRPAREPDRRRQVHAGRCRLSAGMQRSVASPICMAAAPGSPSASGRSTATGPIMRYFRSSIRTVSRAIPELLKIETRYELRPGGCMAITYTSVTDRPTLANIAHHSYFNLDGSDSILDHELMMAADHYLPVDADQIPTGEIRPVEGTDFDFRELRPIRRNGLGRAGPL